MFARHADEGCQARMSAADARSDPLPLGFLQPFTPQRFAASLPLPTPTESSDSSSDLDTESTGSFFPERSHTLGSLIGLQMHPPTEDMHKAAGAAEEGHPAEAAEAEKRKGGGGGRGRTSWCAGLLGCGGAGSNPEALGMSPSLAHLLEEERRSSAGWQPRQASVEDVPELSMMQGNTLFNEQGILPPRPSGAPLKLIVEDASSYLSADWNIYNGGQCSARRETAAVAAPSHGRFPSLWPGLCGRLGTGLAG